MSTELKRGRKRGRKRKAGRPRVSGLRNCPRCGKPGWPFIHVATVTRGSKVYQYRQVFWKHYVPEGYKAAGVSARMSRQCYIGPESPKGKARKKKRKRKRKA